MFMIGNSTTAHANSAWARPPWRTARITFGSEVVETGETKALFKNPQHPYTQALLRAMPPAQGHIERLATIEGQVPSSIAYPQGCRFRERCDQAFGPCAQSHPDLFDTAQGQARCFLRDNNG